MPQLIVGAVAGFFGALPGSIAYAAIQIGASLLVTAASNALLSRSGARRASSADNKRDLALPTEKPAYRFVYGHDIAVGTPAPIRVRGEFLVGCWILNSRPSDFGNWTLYLDKRPVEAAGDPFDFAGPGATGTNGLFAPSGGQEIVRFWFGRGDQTAPPAQILSAYPFATGADAELFKATDAWRGRTVMWAILRAGGSDERQERWPSTPPVVEVIADWSRIWDPRDAAQDPDDPDTWEFSDNHALCVLDALRQNPLKPYPLGSLRVDDFSAAADISDQLVALKAGGSERRYRIAGTVIWSGDELEDQVQPMYAAGAARAVRAGGRLGIVPGAWIAPEITITDLIGDIERTGTQAGDLPTQIRTSYNSADRLGEDAELPPYDIPGAQAADGGAPSVQDLDLGFAASPTQAMRVQKIEGARARLQRRITSEAPPAAFALVSGGTFNLQLARPLTAWNGVYEVQSMNPAVALAENDAGVMLRCPFEALLVTSSIYDWTPATDEVDIETQPFDGQVIAVARPINGTATATANSITVSFQMPLSGSFEQMEIWEATVNNAASADLVSTRGAVAGNTRSFTRSGLTLGTTRFYFARAKNSGGRFSAFTAAVSATTI